MYIFVSTKTFKLQALEILFPKIKESGQNASDKTKEALKIKYFVGCYNFALVHEKFCSILPINHCLIVY